LTPEYASPEQLAGGSITTAADVYALGVLLYVLLSGEHPAGAALRSPAALMHAVVDGDPRRMSDVVAPGRLQRTLRGDLDTIVAKALKKNPQERYSSVAALADDISRYLARQPISARPDTLRYRAAKFVSRNKTAAVLASIRGHAPKARVVVVGYPEILPVDGPGCWPFRNWVSTL